MRVIKKLMLIIYILNLSMLCEITILYLFTIYIHINIFHNLIMFKLTLTVCFHIHPHNNNRHCSHRCMNSQTDLYLTYSKPRSDIRSQNFIFFRSYYSKNRKLHIEWNREEYNNTDGATNSWFLSNENIPVCVCCC